MLSVFVVGVGDGDVGVDFGRFGDAQEVTDGVGGFLAGGDNGLTMGKLGEEGADVGLLHHFEEFVGCVVFLSVDGGGGVEEGDALLLAMGDDVVEAEAFGVGVHKVMLVAEEDLSLQTPVIVDVIWVKKVDAPPFALWRETAEEEHLGIVGQEGDEGMIFHLRGAASDVFSVEIGHGGCGFFVQIAHDGCSFSMQR